VLLTAAPARMRATPPLDEPGTGVMFDAVIELSPPHSKTYKVLFVRYWVQPSEYRIAVLWAEPQGRGLRFPIYPPGLNVVSAPAGFDVSHELVRNRDSHYQKPVGERNLFAYRYGDYQINDIRFADSEARADRIFRADIAPWYPSVGGTSAIVRLSD